MSMPTLRKDYLRAGAFALLAALVAFLGVWITGTVSGHEAQHLLTAMLPTTRFLCSATMTASATTLALMLTLLGMGASVDRSLRPSHYRRIQHIALADAGVFVGATLFLLMLNVPLEAAPDETKLPVRYYDTLYHLVIVLASLLGGVLVAIVIMIYSAVTDMVKVMRSPGESWLTLDEEEDASEARTTVPDASDDRRGPGASQTRASNEGDPDGRGEPRRPAWAKRRRRASVMGI